MSDNNAAIPARRRLEGTGMKAGIAVMLKSTRELTSINPDMSAGWELLA